MSPSDDLSVFAGHSASASASSTATEDFTDASFAPSLAISDQNVLMPTGISGDTNNGGGNSLVPGGDDAGAGFSQPLPPAVDSSTPSQPLADDMFGAPPAVGTNNAGEVDAMNAQMNNSSAPTQSMMMPTVESDAMHAYREQQKRAIEEKESKERAEQQETRAAAAKHIENLAQERKRKLEQKFKNNRENETIASAEQEGIVTGGNVWEAVVRLCPDKPPEHGRVDTSNMRSLYVKLKHSPPLRA